MNGGAEERNLATKIRDKKSGEVRESAVWWIRYRVRGEDVKFSAHTDDYDAAFTLLQKKKAETTQGVPQDRDSERVKVTTLLDILIADYKKRERATSYDAECRIESHLRPFFGNFRAADLMTTTSTAIKIDGVAKAPKTLRLTAN